MSSPLTSYLPPADGLLPKWLLFISVVSLANSIQAYLSLAPTRQVYAGASPNPTHSTTSAARPATSTNQSTALPAGIPASALRRDHASPVTELSARTFGTWTALSSLVRLYAAYYIHDRAAYELALWSFGLAFAHFASEWVVFGTARWGRGLAGPVAVSTVTGTWMAVQYGFYVR